MIMDYEKKYKAAIGKLQKALAPTEDGYKVSGLTRDCLENIFPELKKNDDTQIKKDIIAFLYSKNGYMTPDEDWDFHNKWLAWLENRGEQKPIKASYTAIAETGDGSINTLVTGELSTDSCDDEKKPADKVESKFHPGDWIVDNETLNDVFCVIEVLEEIYKVIDIDGDDYHIPHCKTDKQFHLWSTADAKDGDVLVNSKGQPFIFSGKYDDRNSGNPIAYCGVNCQNKFKISNGTHWTNKREVAPATKEQRDLLFQKMKEDGYEWDTEKKELKKIKSEKLDADKVIEWLKHCELHDWDIFTTIIPDDSPTSNPHRVRRLTDDFINNFKKNFKI